MIASEVQVSKYGAYTCAGNGTAAVAAVDPVNEGPANAMKATSITTMERDRCTGTSFPNSCGISQVAVGRTRYGPQ